MQVGRKAGRHEGMKEGKYEWKFGRHMKEGRKVKLKKNIEGMYKPIRLQICVVVAPPTTVLERTFSGRSVEHTAIDNGRVDAGGLNRATTDSGVSVV
jgi:hypothetical protein